MKAPAAGSLNPGMCVALGVVLLAMASASTGCSGISEKVLKEANRNHQAFPVGPEDILEVVVWRNKDLSREEVVVRPDGRISVPLIGDVQASGLTAEELSRHIAEGLKQYMETPTVSVSLKEVNSYTIYVLGEVRQPGKFQLKSYATVLQAVAMAGGFTQFASRNDMQVIRPAANGENGSQEIRIPVSYEDLLSGNGQIGNFILRAGDVVVVP